MNEFARGLAISVRRPHFAIAIWLVQAGLAAVLALPISNFLHAELNHSPAAEAMIAAPNARWWITEQRTHPELLGTFPEKGLALFSEEGSSGFGAFDGAAGIGAGFLGLGLLAVVLHAFLLGGIFGSLANRGADLTVFAREGARRLPAFLVVTLGAAGLVAALYHWVYWASGRALAGFSANLATEQSLRAVVLVRLAALVAVVTVVKVAADAIRVALVERPDLPPVTRYLVGVGSALGRFGRILATLALWAAATAVLYVLWSRLNVSSAATTTGGVVLLVAAQQVFIFLRAILKVGYYAGIRETILRRAVPTPAPEPAA
ncbi:MAG TPA: hypothetical protein VFS34_01975 [Thermoanaerobaculia bacterium]|nr:hypothetical protein [Thermoanaerobaculia bacterium]